MSEQQMQSVYQTKIDYEKAKKILLDKIMPRETVDENFKAKYVNACNANRIALEYYPIVKMNDELTYVSFDYSGESSYVSGYSGTIEGDTVRINKEYSTYKYEGSHSLSGSSIEKRFVDATIIDSHINNLCESKIEKKNIEVPQWILANCLEKCESEIKTKLSTAAKQAAMDTHLGKVTQYKYEHKKGETEIWFYPMYKLRIDKYEFWINGIDGSIPKFDYPRNQKYREQLAKYKRKDIFPKIFLFTLLALTVAAMIYVLYTIISEELNVIRMGFVEGIYEEQADTDLGWFFIIGGNILVCAVWVGLIAFALWLLHIFGGPYEFTYKDEEESGGTLKNIKFNKSVVGFYFASLLFVGIACVLMAIYVAISSLLIIGGTDTAFGLILGTV